MQRPTTTAKTPTPRPKSILAVLGASKTLFFLAAGISFVLSIWLWFSGDRERGLFVGLWVPSILSAGALLMAGDHDE